MNRKCITVVSASVLVMLAGLASAQPQVERAQQTVQLADRVKEMRVNLVEAITAAEAHCKGIAIRARISTSMEPQRMQMQMMNQPTTESPARQPVTRPASPGTGQRPGVEPAPRMVEPSPGAPDDLYAIVTCVIGNSKVREVIVNLDGYEVLGMRPMPAMRGMMRPESVDPQSARPTGLHLVRATDLMNVEVQSAEGDTLGDVDDLAIDPDSRRVVYGVLRRGGFFGMGESRYALPADELTGLADGCLMLNLKESDFKGQKGFDNANWPMRGNPKWDVTKTPGAGESPTAKRIVKASNMIGSPVESLDGKQVGKVTDLVVDSASGAIKFIVVRVDQGFLALPQSAMKMKEAECVAQLSAADLLAKPTFDADHEPKWNDAEWNRQTIESFGG